MSQTKRSFNDSITKMLEARISQYKVLNHATCIKMYLDIFNVFSEVLSQVKTGLSNESINYIAQQYYDTVKVNNTHSLDPNIFDKRAKLHAIPTNELGLMAVMLRDTDFVYPLIEEIKKRS
jgi:hypothetical protein